MSVVVDIPFTRSRILLATFGNTVGLLSECLAGRVCANQSCQISSAETLVEEKLEQDVVRRVGTESCRKEAIRGYCARVCSADDGLDLGASRTCDDGMRTSKLD